MPYGIAVRENRMICQVPINIDWHSQFQYGLVLATAYENNHYENYGCCHIAPLHCHYNTPRKGVGAIYGIRHCLLKKEWRAKRVLPGY